MKTIKLSVFAAGLFTLSSGVAWSQAIPLSTKSLVQIQDKKVEPKTFVIENELDDLFGHNGCDLPQKIREKLASKNKIGVIPTELRDILGNDIKAKALKVSGLSAQASLHMIEAREGEDVALLRLVGTHTYSSTPATSFIDDQASNIAFTMDCSGYLNAVISAEGAVPIVSARSAAQSALQSNNALIVIRAAVFSPIALAMNPSLGSTKLLPSQRTDLLYAMVVEAKTQFPSASDAMMLKSWRELNLVWTSNQGNGSLQGKMSLAANAGVGAAPALFSSATDAGATMSKGVTFASFNTYILEEDLTGPVELSLGAVRAMVGDLISQASPSAPASLAGSAYIASYPTIPQNICSLYWTVQSLDSTADDTSPGVIRGTWRENECKMKYEPKQAITGGESLKVTANSGMDSKQTFVLNYPIGEE